MKTVAFVPIKMNSQRLPHKNILPLGEHALCWYIFDTLLNVKEIDEVYVYCSDDRIVDYIPENVIYKKRSEQLDGDLVKGYDIYQSFISEVDADVYILAHATSPFIKSETIDSALSNVLYNGNDSAFSAQRIQTFSWFKGKPLNYEFEDVPRTQDIEPVLVETSAFYIFKKEVFTVHKRRIGFNPYIQEVDDVEAIDIDEKKDYDLACKII
jgi:CMP-N-acetylneuraminic acid synthetase